MYAKIFTQIYDGTLCTKGPWQALVTFQQLLILADQDGNIDMTLDAISRRTTIPLNVLQTGIAPLLEPDPLSRTPDEEGKRLIPLMPGRAWGWHVVNYEHYRQLKREEDRREYHRAYWHSRKKDSTPLNTTQETQPTQPIAEAKAEAVISIAKAMDVAGAAGPPTCPHEKLIALYHELLPSNPRVIEWNQTRSGYLRSRWREKAACKDEGYETVDQGLAWWRRFFAYVGESRFLTGKTDGRDGKPPFVASLEWIVRPTNFAKVIEGNYHRG